MNHSTFYRSPASGLGLSWQYWDVVSRTEYTQPEKYLMLAVLRDAILEYRNNFASGNRIYRNARTWFFEESSDRLFSFESICDGLNLSPLLIRKQLLSAAQRSFDRRFRKSDVRFSSNEDRSGAGGASNIPAKVCRLTKLSLVNPIHGNE